jgi:hypothetical protein
LSGARKTKQLAISPGLHRAADYVTEMQEQINKPIFVVGSPRSGTSVLTWCLGQHPNIVPLPESGWMGDFAIDLAIRYQIGTARGERSVLSAMDIQREEFFASFGQSINNLILSHRKDLERRRSATPPGGSSRVAGAFEISRSRSEPKARWVDGTPLYSFHICGLRKIFPKALFIHIVRDVTSVVRSMLNFHRVGGNSLVANEQEAYNYWLSSVNSCLLAERAYGPRVVLRLRYSELVDTPEMAMRSVLKFVGERYSTACLTPLQERINSSNVPPDFKIGSPETDPAVIERATRLCAEVQETAQPLEASSAVADEIEAAFDERVRYVATVDSEYYRSQQIIATLQKENAALATSYHVELRRLQVEHAARERSYDVELRRLQAEHAALVTSYHVELRRLQAESAARATLSRAKHQRDIAELTKRLREQLWDTRKLLHLLDEVENAAARLRSSRRWKLANPVTAIEAKLFPDKVSLGYGHLEKIVALYLQWRTSRPEIAKIDDQIKTFTFPTAPKSPEIEGQA